MERFATRTASVASGSDKTLINLFNPAATPTCRGRVYDIIIASAAAPADQTADFLLNRTTAVGTEGSGLVPHNILGGPAGAYDSGLGVFTVEPTYTAGAILAAIPGVNQRATARWVAPPGAEVVLAATQNNGAGLKTVTSSSTQAYGATIWFAE